MRYVYRCSVCKAIIPKGQKMCETCEIYYPCNKCTRDNKTTCMCKKWKKWFHLQWQLFYRPRKKIIAISPENEENSPENEEKPSE